MRRLVLLLFAIAPALGLPGCRARDELPNPPINTLQFVPRGAPREFTRARGIVELYLTPNSPARTFWNDPKTKTNPWGTITLKDVRPDGTVVIDFSGTELRARQRQVFPGTGIKVIASNPSMGTTLLRSRWTHTIMEE